MRRNIKNFLKEEIRKQFPQMPRTSASKLARDLEPILIKFSSIPPTESATILGAGIRLLTDQIAEKHRVSKDKVSLVAIEGLKRFAFELREGDASKDAKNITNFFLGCNPEDTEYYAILVAFDDVADRIKKYLNEVQKKGKVLNGSYKGVGVSVIATGMGSPTTAIYMEALARTRTKVIFRVGSAGGLQRNVKLDDLVIPYAAIRSEGTTLSYAPLTYPAVADIDLVESARETCRELNYTYHVGTIITTDAIFQENEDFIYKWNALGVLAADMETSTLYVVGARKGLRVLSVLSISDNPLLQTRFYDFTAHNERRHPGFQNAIMAVLETIRKLGT
jgi:uridine phosphorylase